MNIIDKILFESKQRGVLYHYTNISNATRILQMNMFRCSDIGDINNKLKTINGYKYGLSLTRDKNFHKTSNRLDAGINGVEVRFNLDGDKLSNRYSIVPFNFFNDSTRASKTESEEIVLSDEVVENALSYIISITLIEENITGTNQVFIKPFTKFCEDKNIPLNFIKN